MRRGLRRWLRRGYVGRLVSPEIDLWLAGQEPRLADWLRLAITSSSGFTADQGPIVRHASAGLWVPAGAGQPKGLAGAQHWRNQLPTADLRDSAYSKWGYNGSPIPVFLDFTAGIDGTPDGAQIWRFVYGSGSQTQIFRNVAPPYSCRQAHLCAMRLLDGTGVVQFGGWDIGAAVNLTTQWKRVALIGQGGQSRFSVSWLASQNPTRQSADIAIDVKACPPLWQLGVPYDQNVPDLLVRSDSSPGIYTDPETGTQFIHWGGGYCSAFHRPQGSIVSNILTRTAGIPITDARFMGALPAMSSAVRTLPTGTFSGKWTNAATRGAAPGGGRQLTGAANPSTGTEAVGAITGASYLAARLLIANNNSTSGFKFSIYYGSGSDETAVELTWAAIAEGSGSTSGSGTGTYKITRLTTSGPHGTPVWQIDIWRTANPAETYTCALTLDPSPGSDQVGKIVYLYGMFVASVPALRPLGDDLVVVTSGTVTRLAETIDAPAVTIAGPATVLAVLDLSDGLPAVDTVVLSSGAWALSLLATGQVRATDGTTTITSTATVTGSGVRTIGVTADELGSRLRIDGTTEAHEPLDMSGITTLALGAIPVTRAPRVWSRTMGAAELLNA